MGTVLNWSLLCSQTMIAHTACLQAVVRLLLYILARHKHSNKENESVTQYCPLSSFSLTRRTSKASSKASEANRQTALGLHLDWDTLQEVIARLAYPISQWCDHQQKGDVVAPDKSSRKRRP